MTFCPPGPPLRANDTDSLFTGIELLKGCLESSSKLLVDETEIFEHKRSATTKDRRNTALRKAMLFTTCTHAHAFGLRRRGTLGGSGTVEQSRILLPENVGSFYNVLLT